MHFNDDGTTSADASATVRSTSTSSCHSLERYRSMEWSIFFMVWLALWATIGQVSHSTFGMTSPSYISQLTMPLLHHTNTNEDMETKSRLAISNRKEKLTGWGLYLGRFNKRWLQESIHYPITFLLDQQRTLPSYTITNPDVASHVWPCKKKKDSTYNQEKGRLKNDYERFSSTRSKSSRRDMGLFSRVDLQMVIHRDLAVRISSRIIRIQPEDHQDFLELRRSLRPGQTVPPTLNSGSANPFRPVARCSETVGLEGVVQGL